jgi:hypothetical protein
MNGIILLGSHTMKWKTSVIIGPAQLLTGLGKSLYLVSLDPLKTNEVTVIEKVEYVELYNCGILFCSPTVLGMGLTLARQALYTTELYSQPYCEALNLLPP